MYICAAVCSVVSDSMQPQGLQPARFLCPWDSPGKNTGVGCHVVLHIFLIQKLNPSLLHCRWILCHLHHLGNLRECIQSILYKLIMFMNPHLKAVIHQALSCDGSGTTEVSTYLASHARARPHWLSAIFVNVLVIPASEPLYLPLPLPGGSLPFSA